MESYREGASRCPRCAEAMDPERAGYDASGELVCARCLAIGQVGQADALIQDKDPTTNRNLYGAAAAASLLGLSTCCTSGLGVFFFVLCPVPMFIGGATIYRVLADGAAKERLGNGFYAVLALSALGIAFGGLGTLLGLLGMVGMGLR
ncbi:MAG: hypothetical protein VYE22_31525 [Myxococcota bacterium]|nr:hypothetical protein [Myxococcota bacterium]